MFSVWGLGEWWENAEDGMVSMRSWALLSLEIVFAEAFRKDMKRIWWDSVRPEERV